MSAYVIFFSNYFWVFLLCSFFCNIFRCVLTSYSFFDIFLSFCIFFFVVVLLCFFGNIFILSVFTLFCFWNLFWVFLHWLSFFKYTLSFLSHFLTVFLLLLLCECFYRLLFKYILSAFNKLFFFWVFFDWLSFIKHTLSVFSLLLLFYHYLSVPPLHLLPTILLQCFHSASSFWKSFFRVFCSAFFGFLSFSLI